MDVCQHANQPIIADRNELDMLNVIVEAMLASQSRLQDASVAQWSRILVESCRRQRARDTGSDTRPDSQVAA